MTDDDGKGLRGLRRGRLGRMAMLGKMAAGVAGAAASAAGTWVSASRDEAEAALHRRAARRMVASLGEMKGLPMKLGQLYSYLDGVVPAQYQPIYDEVLGKLRTRTKPMRWEVMRKVLREELGDDAEARFARLETEPLAAASIGQVYRAALQDGREVVVKIQYPGIREAIASDLKNVEGLLSAMSAVLPRMQIEQGLSDLTGRIEEECDYRIELAHQQRFAELWEGDPEVMIPGVHPELSTARVLVSDFVPGRSWEAMLADPELDQEERDRVGRVLFRFVFGSLYRHGLFNADPHPGNYLFLDDGRIAFLDFGCVQTYTPETLAAIREVRDLIVDHADAPRLREAIARDFQVPDVFDDDMWAMLVRYMRFCFEPLAAAQPFRFTRAYTAQITQMTMDAKMMAARKMWRTGIQEPRIQGFVFLTRIIFGLSSILARLDAQADWLALTRACEAGEAMPTQAA